MSSSSGHPRLQSHHHSLSRSLVVVAFKTSHDVDCSLASKVLYEYEYVGLKSEKALDRGEKLYGSTRFNAAGKLVPDGVKSVGVRQRVHEVEARADGWHVRLRLGGEAGPGRCCPPLIDKHFEPSFLVFIGTL